MIDRLKIAAKLFIGFGVLLLLLLGLSSFSTLNSLRSQSIVADLAEQKTNEVLDERIQKRIQEGRMQLWMALGTGDPAHWTLSDAAFKAANDDIQVLAQKAADPARQTKVREWADLLQVFLTESSKFRAFHGHNESLDSEAGKAVFATAVKAAATLLGASEALSKDYKDAADRAEADASQAARSAVTLAAGIGIASLVVGLGLSFLLTRSIRRPIVALTRVMQTLASGDLTVAIPHAGDPNEMGDMAGSVAIFKENALERQRLEKEAAASRAAADAERDRTTAEQARLAHEQAEVVRRLGEGLKCMAEGDLTARLGDGFTAAYARIRDDFNEAIDKLKGTLVSVVANARAIESGTSEISTATDDLSRRTEQQAASLEETAASLEEITSVVKQTAVGAKRARDVVSVAKVDAEKSGDVVHRAKEAMSGIERSSKQIGQIIGVIDEIAFQTNLLALNAGVEAARAGEAGRGFAVVASEVRALAQRSADAAKEIKSLISDSAAQVEQGVELVSETGQALERIVAQVSEIDSVVSAIAESAQEQATGLAQINTAINQMDQVTQQNAAMVEESTAAARTLSQETSDLSRLISHFRIEEDARRGAAASGPRRSRAA